MLLCVLASPGGGDDGVRTHDPLLAGQVLSQLSYTPILGFSFFLNDHALWSLKIEQQAIRTSLRSCTLAVFLVLVYFQTTRYLRLCRLISRSP